ncbi:DUF3618 domain-containing protein [Georgenia yuyongxinii]|uniref:DUF3618 domain-containing protein n=1 Tax=Georgenia yuyongxinii TaxID=2589797 RepID=A0A552WUU9_9MICO|nr:DUF3618 domain-containing protein [Georgenia yuyongxinii]TRW46527.1 DUF3618 domain-containing protein [Georgenia yuyongxinii]
MSEERKRTAEEIEADLARTRRDLTSTVNELSDKLDPRNQVEAARTAAQAKARTFADDVSSGQPKALAIAGGAVAFVGLLVVAAARRRG